MKKLTATICLTVAVLLGSEGTSWSAEPNWNLLKSNSFLWGQTTGCVLRFKHYVNLTAGPVFKKESIQQMIKTILGDLDGLLEQLVIIGKEGGHLQGMSIEDFDEMVLSLSREEFKNHGIWLQSLGCYKNLRDLNIVE